MAQTIELSNSPCQHTLTLLLKPKTMNIYYLRKFRKLAKRRFKLVYYTNRVVIYYHTNSLWDMTLSTEEKRTHFLRNSYRGPKTYISEAQSMVRRMMRDEILIRVRQIPKKKRK